MLPDIVRELSGSVARVNPLCISGVLALSFEKREFGLTFDPTRWDTQWRIGTKFARPVKLPVWAR